MKHCETCEHWAKYPHLRGIHGLCRKIPSHERIYGETPPDMPVFVDISGVYGALMTNPTFGCTMHEENP